VAIQYLTELQLLAVAVGRINLVLRAVLEVQVVVALEVEAPQRALVGRGHLVKEAMVVLAEGQAVIWAGVVVVQVL